jgi:hypothetical protein
MIECGFELHGGACRQEAHSTEGWLAGLRAFTHCDLP